MLLRLTETIELRIRYSLRHLNQSVPTDVSIHPQFDYLAVTIKLVVVQALLFVDKDQNLNLSKAYLLLFLPRAA